MFRTIRRLALSAVFLWSAVNALQNAEHMTGPAEALDLPEAEKMVRLHGAVNLLGGIMLVLNIKPRLAAWSMIANLIPTTLGGHRFWEETDEGARTNQMVHFFKNVGLVGGLLTVIASERNARRVAELT